MPVLRTNASLAGRPTGSLNDCRHLTQDSMQLGSASSSSHFRIHGDPARLAQGGIRMVKPKPLSTRATRRLVRPPYADLAQPHGQNRVRLSTIRSHVFAGIAEMLGGPPSQVSGGQLAVHGTFIAKVLLTTGNGLAHVSGQALSSMNPRTSRPRSADKGHHRPVEIGSLCEHRQKRGFCRRPIRQRMPKPAGPWQIA